MATTFHPNPMLRVADSKGAVTWINCLTITTLTAAPTGGTRIDFGASQYVVLSDMGVDELGSIVADLITGKPPTHPRKEHE